jgi:hypothetical protein
VFFIVEDLLQKLLTFSAALLLTAAFASADTFTNGNFESGDFTGWTRGSGVLGSGQLTNNLVPSSYLPTGANYNAAYDASGIVTAGLDPHTDNNLNMVYSGTYSARVNDQVQNNSISVISQTVNNYTASNIYFAWAAVLQNSHGPTDSDVFQLTLTDETTSTILYNVTYNSATAPSGLFTQSSTNWFYTNWQVANLDVSKLQGDTFTLTLLAADCPYGGHAGYVYLDGFGSVIPPPSNAPEPASLSLVGASLVGACLYLRRKRANRA